MKRTVLLSLFCILAALSMTAHAHAIQTVPVSVDGQTLTGVSHLIDGVTWTPLRSLCDQLGHWQVFWDGSSRTGMAVQVGHTIAANVGDGVLTVDGKAVGTGVFLRDGCTYVPLRAVCQALGFAVRWDAALGGAAVTSASENSIIEDDLYWLSRIISAESRGESLEGQIAVGAVILNRVRSDSFPDTILEVIFDTRDAIQFEPVGNGTVYQEPTAQSVEAARTALNGGNPIGDCLYFYAPALSQGLWINANCTYYKTIGCHRFYL